ncbi:MAG: autotransporter domain-containing protein [Hyphomicrobium sp.]|uniref:autotransporter family protein n=1 Tax=Hyphomicrobium sp. TaxID=82 RepID=UPI0039E2D399
MSISVHRIRSSSSRFLLGSLAAALSMGVSHQALAACTASPTSGITVDCEGVSTNSSPLVNTGTNPSTSGDGGNAAVNLAPGSVFTNLSTIDVYMADGPNNTAGTSGFQRTRLYGVSGSDEGDYEVFNSGTITVTHSGVGRLWGVAANGDTESMETTNSGTIQIVRGPITLGTVSAISLTAHAAALGNQSLDVAASVYSEEEVESDTITNKSSGIIKATGLLTAGIYSRAGDATIVNDGQIIQTTPAQGFAIAKVSDSGEVRTLDLTNSGTITGDILAVGGQAQRWWALSNGLGGTIDSRLSINSQFGAVDSTIDNTGTITGKIYYGNGEHVLTNAKGATITGDIDVDQRIQVLTGRTCTVGNDGCFATATTTGTTVVGNPTAEELNENSASTITTGAASGSTTTYTLSMWGAKSFTFDNAGTYVGNLTVETQGSGTVGAIGIQDSEVNILPHIFGGGGASANTASGAGTIALIDGTLKIADGIVNGTGGTSSIARTTTIAPVLDGTVKSGEWYTVASQLYGSDLPTVENTALVTWDAQKNASGALVIGSDVADASSISGISRPGAAAINTLIASGGAGSDPTLNALGGAVEGLTEQSDVAKAGAQLAPETTYATQQSAITLNNVIGQHIDTRLNGVGATGVSQGYSNGPYGLGMKPSQDDPNRMSLGGSLKDDDGVVIAPRSAALWGQAFGAGLNQDGREQVDGYDARIYGFIAGYDNWISPNVRLGVAGGYANTNIDGDGNTTANNTGIDSYLIEAYGAFKGDGWYATGRTGFTWHDYETTRYLTVPYGDRASGNHDGDQFNAAIEFGVPLAHAGTVITPVAGLTYSRLHQDGYSETSDGGMALAVDSQNNNSLVSSLGLKGLVPIADGTVVEGRALWLHEFQDDAQVVNASFAAGGGTFTAAGPGVGRDTADLGIGMLAQIGGGTTFEINYDANVREDYLAHVGSARLDVHF